MRTLADLLDRLGGVPLDRIHLRPFPGSATVQDSNARRPHLLSPRCPRKPILASLGSCTTLAGK
jgi:hypothetical protein